MRQINLQPKKLVDGHLPGLESGFFLILEIITGNYIEPRVYGKHTGLSSLAVLIAGTVLFDLGVQACLISHQTIVYSLDPAARSRLNAVLVSAMFLAMGLGAALASQALVLYGWVGVMTLGAGAAALAMGVRLLPERGGAAAVR